MTSIASILVSILTIIGAETFYEVSHLIKDDANLPQVLIVGNKAKTLCSGNTYRRESGCYLKGSNLILLKELETGNLSHHREFAHHIFRYVQWKNNRVTNLDAEIFAFTQNFASHAQKNNLSLTSSSKKRKITNIITEADISTSNFIIFEAAVVVTQSVIVNEIRGFLFENQFNTELQAGGVQYFVQEAIFETQVEDISFRTATSSYTTDITKTQILDSDETPKVIGHFLAAPNPISKRGNSFFGYRLNVAANVEILMFNRRGMKVGSAKFAKNTFPGGEGRKYNQVFINSFLNMAKIPTGIYLSILKLNGKIEKKTWVEIQP